MKANAALFLFLIALIVQNNIAYSFGSRRGCSCYLSDKGKIREDGAVVTNASACIQRVSKNRRWCEFDVLALENQARTQEITKILVKWSRSSDSTEFKDFLFRSLNNISFKDAIGNKNDKFDIETLEQVRNDKINIILRKNKSLLSKCLKYFTSKHSIFINSKNLICEFDKTTLWLDIYFLLERYNYIMSVKYFE